MVLSESVTSALTSGSVVALPLALMGGLVAGFNPCCLALYPAAVASCCGGRSCDAPRSLPNALAFVLGVAAAITVLGVVVSLVGRVTGLGTLGRYVVATVPLMMGMHLMGWVHLPLPEGPRSSVGRGAGSAFGTGFLLSLVIAPCGTPVLASVLSYAAYQGQVLYGALLSFLYGLGIGAPMLLVGTAAGGLAQRLDSGGWKVWVDRSVGALLLTLGFYLLWRA